MAVFHETGQGGLEPCLEKAISLYTKAAKLGLEEAVEVLALRGHIVSSSEEDEEGNNEREKGRKLYAMGRAYHYGLSGCPVDKHYAAELYRLSSQTGHRKAKRFWNTSTAEHCECPGIFTKAHFVFTVIRFYLSPMLIMVHALCPRFIIGYTIRQMDIYMYFN